MKKDLVIIGGGPAGLAAAIAARDAGVEDLLILERDARLGGILNQCIHNGFGLHTFREELTGPEYAGRYIDQVLARDIPCKLNTMVVDLSDVPRGAEGEKGEAEGGPKPERPEGRKKSVCLVTVMNREEGIYTIEAGAVILAMGCRERSRGALNIPGFRPAGIYSAGTAQRYVNMEGRMPGREVVILGSGDIGLIMARRMTLEGARVKLVAELMPYSGGLKRNIVQCLDDFGIPLKLSHTVVDIRGKERVEAVVIARVDEYSRPIPGTEETVTCDTLLLSCGLIPENELSDSLGVEMNPATNGPKVNESLETDREGVFACGNVLHVHDLVDFVSEEAAEAGKHAAFYVMGSGERSVDREIPLLADRGVRYTVPEVVHPSDMEKAMTVRFRVSDVYRGCYISVYFDEERVLHKKRQIVAPGEMEAITLTREQLLAYPELKQIVVKMEER